MADAVKPSQPIARPPAPVAPDKVLFEGMFEVLSVEAYDVPAVVMEEVEEIEGGKRKMVSKPHDCMRRGQLVRMVAVKGETSHPRGEVKLEVLTPLSFEGKFVKVRVLV